MRLTCDCRFQGETDDTNDIVADSFPASQAFDTIDSSLRADEAERKTAIKQGDAVFSFVLKNTSGNTESWYIDLKREGKVGRGEAPAGTKPDIILSLSDEDFGKLVAGKTQAQRLFMSGKLKVKGDVMKVGAQASKGRSSVLRQRLMLGTRLLRWNPYSRKHRPRRNYRHVNERWQMDWNYVDVAF